jgi:3',5'-nucleoside bisphosphate phosphatase
MSMKYHYDLHIHSVLSPCADDLMTPNNIFNMANLKGLNIIAVTDHNSMKQLPILFELEKSYDMLLIPGVELTLEDDSHVLCYFRRLEDAITFDHYLETCIHKRVYDPEIFGTQDITDIHDAVIDTIPYHLIDPLSLSIHQLVDVLKDLDHILVYAHVDKHQNSGLRHVHHVKLDAIELTRHHHPDFLIINHLEDRIILINSDAHIITDISECTDQNTIELESLTIEAFFNYFGHG